MTEILKKHYSNLGEVDKAEVLRYAYAKDIPNDRLIFSSAKEMGDVLSPDVLYTFLPVNIEGETVVFPGYKAESKSLAKHLDGCTGAVVFFATIGHTADRIIKKYSVVSPTKSLISSAVGSERVERVCDIFCEELEKENPCLEFSSRFSPGYGDLNISMQKYIFDLLGAGKKCAAVLGENYFILPTKTVTAIVGYREK